MPTRKRRPPRRGGIRLEDPNLVDDLQNMDRVAILLYGPGSMAALLLDLDGSYGFESWEEAQATWEANKELLLSLVTEDPRRTDFRLLPGQRPWAWWSFEAELPRDKLEDMQRFTPHRFQEWQLRWLKKYGQLRDGEEEAVQRVKAKIKAAEWKPPRRPAAKMKILKFPLPEDEK